MSNFKHLQSSVFTFDNGYQVHFEAMPGMGTVFTFIFYKGDKIPVGNYIDVLGKNDNYCGYLSAEDFIAMCFKVSKALPPESIKNEG
jgi:hypothetical protein